MSAHKVIISTPRSRHQLATDRRLRLKTSDGIDIVPLLIVTQRIPFYSLLCCIECTARRSVLRALQILLHVLQSLLRQCICPVRRCGNPLTRFLSLMKATRNHHATKGEIISRSNKDHRTVQTENLKVNEAIRVPWNRDPNPTFKYPTIPFLFHAAVHPPPRCQCHGHIPCITLPDVVADRSLKSTSQARPLVERHARVVHQLRPCRAESADTAKIAEV